MIDLRPLVSSWLGGMVLLIGLAVGGWCYLAGVKEVYRGVVLNYARVGSVPPSLGNYAKACFQKKPCRDAYALTPWRRMSALQKSATLMGIFAGAMLVVIGGGWRPALEAANRARLEALRQNSVPDQSARTPGRMLLGGG